MHSAIPQAYTAGFPSHLRQWRRGQMLKQDALARILGVTQAAVSRWENGLDDPSPRLRERLRGLMAANLRDELAVERLILSRQTSTRALFDVDGVRLVGLSKGAQATWPDYCRFTGRCMRDRAVGEVQQIIENASLMREIQHGEIALISGVSIENLRFRRTNKFKHRWTLAFRQVGQTMLADMNYEKAEAEDRLGVHEILRIDEI